MAERTVMLSVDCADDQEFVNVFEHLGRICAGLILEGRTTRIFAADIEEEGSDGG